MQAKIDTLRVKDENDSEYLLYPKTLTKSVIDEDGNTLDNMLTDLEKRIGSSGSTGSGGSTSITVDTAMSDTSTNPVQNSVVKKYIDDKEVTLSEEAGNAIETKEDGIYVADKSAEIAQIQNDLAPITKYQKYVNTELGYCYATISSDVALSAGTVLPFTFNNGNMEMDSTNYSVKLKAGKTYEISSDVAISATSGGAGAVDLTIYDLTSDKELSCFSKLSTNQGSSNNDISASVVYTPDNDCEVQLKVKNLWAATNVCGAYNSYFKVQEINRQIVIDPLNYVNENQGIEDAPVGHIISFMGNNPPDHYLSCDGTEYNISDYPYLAQHFIDQFGSVNHFGGDGSTTFAVPDLRGEFLRGTGTALRNTGTGGAVGEHQDGTEIPNLYTGSNRIVVVAHSNGANEIENADHGVTDSAVSGITSTASSNTTSTDVFSYTSRPTNTAVLYCIKYEPTYFMVHKDYNTNYLQPTLYSEEERVVGCWINGKPLYEKTIKVADTIAAGAEIYVDVSDCNAETMMVVPESTIGTTHSGLTLNANWSANSEWSFLGEVHLANQRVILQSGSAVTISDIVLTIQYTKTTDAEGSFTTQMITDYAVAGYNNTVFPDYTNEIAKITTEGASYTATENCVVTGWAKTTAMAAAYVCVDGVPVGGIFGYPQPEPAVSVQVYVKAGQTVTTMVPGNYTLTIYGLQS